MKNHKQNPLGIIATFATLSEAFGTVVLKFLPYNIQIIFVWFVMIFPIILVISFFILLYKRPIHFYSPDYYTDDEHFLRAINAYYSQVSNSNMPDDVKEDILQSIEHINDGIVSYRNFITITIHGTKIEASTVKDFYKKVFDYLAENQIDFQRLIPFRTGQTRYLINTEDKHINNTPFVNPYFYGGYFWEANKSRNGARLDILKFLKALNLDVI